MRMFFNFSSHVVTIPDITIPILRIQTRKTVAPFYSFMWFNVFKALEFPEITGITKNYIFLYCSDHESDDPSAGSFWGQGNNLDLTDIEFGGKIINGTESPETPYMFRTQNGDIGVGWHPNPTPQSTYLTTLNGSGSLTNIVNDDGTNPGTNWTSHGVVLDPDEVPIFELGDNTHTGYATFKKLSENSFKAKGVLRGARGGDCVYGWWLSSDGISWSYGGNYQRTIPGMDTYYNSQQSQLTPFQKNGVWWALGYAISGVEEGDQNLTETRKMYLAKIDDIDGTNPVFVKWMYDFNYIRGCSIYQEGDVIHVYIRFSRYSWPGSGDLGPLYHATLDISMADKWMFPHTSSQPPATPQLISAELQ